MDEYRRLADSFREGEDLSLSELRLLERLAKDAGNYLLVNRVYARIRRQINHLAKEAR